jgi:diguanylate cyclase (GGDEF)-like protein
VAELPRRIGFADVSMYLYSEEDGLLTLAETNHRRPIDLAVGAQRSGGQFMLQAVRSRRLHASRDIWAEAAAVGEGLRIAPDARERYADGACLVAPLHGEQALHGVLNFSRRRPRAVHVPAARLDAIFAFLGRTLEHARLHQRARTEARIDGLTGLANYRAFRESLEREVKRAGRFGGPLSLAALDLDGLKGVNDMHGHPAGDFILRNVAARITSVLRRFDLAARVGGDEFALILPATDLPGARHVATRIAELLQRDPPRYEERAINISASCGIAQLDGSHGPDDLIREADRALYTAKRQGRNRVVCGTPDSPPMPARQASVVSGWIP